MSDINHYLNNETSLDPKNWAEMRALGHQMVEDMFDLLQHIREKPVWQQPTQQALNNVRLSKSSGGESTEDIYNEFKESILPYYKGNIHPKYWAWVEGTGTPFSMLGDMLAAGMNSNGNNGDHMAMYVEQEVIDWLIKVLNLSATANGSLVSGGSMANLSALLVARDSFLEQKVRKTGLLKYGQQLTMYASSEAHTCVVKSADIIGIGTENVRIIEADQHFQLDMVKLRAAIAEDRKQGLVPFCICANAGTVKTGAIDPLEEIAELCKQEGLWFHVDGAFGALAKLTPEFQATLKSLEKADSLAFDLHKWLYIPYGIGCVLFKNGDLMKDSYALPADYLAVHDRGLAAGPEPLSNSSIEMSRGFKSLKVWMSIKEHGVDGFARLIGQNIAQAFYLGDLINTQHRLQLITQVTLNVVCFRYLPEGERTEDELNQLNKEIVMRLHEAGLSAPSYAVIKGRYCIRVAIVNHRTRQHDLDELVRDILKIANEIVD